MFQDGLIRVLEEHTANVEILGVAQDWSEAKRLITTLQPDVLIADYGLADTMIPELEHLAMDETNPLRILFIIMDENKIILYQRQQFTDITIERLIEAL